MRNTGELIGRGRTADVYGWGDDQALKLYGAGLPRELAEAEYQAAAAISRVWGATPAVHDVVQVDGRYGVVYERVRGPSLLQAVLARPWTVWRAAELMAELHVRMHAVSAPGLPDLSGRLRQAILSARPLPGGLKNVALAALARWPTQGALCHGDFHPDNILLAARGPVVLDWLDAASGPPQADVARTSLLLQYAALPPDMPRRWLLEATRGVWRRVYLRHYYRRSPTPSAPAAAWLLPVAAGRLSENIPEENQTLLALAARLAGERPAAPHLRHRGA